MNPKSAALRLVLLAASCATVARAAPPPGVTLSGGWMRVITPQVPAGGYFALHNGSTASVTLTGASSPGCGMLMLHHTSDTNGMSSMTTVRNVVVPPGGQVDFAPGGYHLMCMQPAPTMRPGGRVPVTLTFAGGASLDATFAVRSATGR